MNRLRSFPGRIACLLLLVPSLAQASAALDDAIAKFKGGSLPEAKAAFLSVAQTEPSEKLAPYYLAEIAKKEKDYDTMLAQATRVTELSPDWYDGWISLGEAWGKKARNAGLFDKLDYAKRCCACFEKAVAVAPKELEPRRALIEFCWQAPDIAGGGDERAARELQQLYSLDFTAASVFENTRLLKQSKYSEVFRKCEEGLARNPAAAVLKWQFGYAAALSGTRLAEGLTFLEEAQKAPPEEDLPPAPEIEFRIAQVRKALEASAK